MSRALCLFIVCMGGGDGDSLVECKVIRWVIMLLLVGYLDMW